jgi:hypothetical protein
MAQGKYVGYFRVSTDRQGRSGLGLDAQREAVSTFLNGGDWQLVASFTEVESGKHENRPELIKAMAACRLYGAKLVIAKLDRLSRDVHFLTGLERAGIQFVAADMPEANEMVVHMMAVVAQAERKMISARTKAALAQKRKWYAGLNDEQRAELLANGKAVQLGGDRGKGTAFTPATTGIGRAARTARANARKQQLAPVLSDLRASGVTTLAAIAAALTERGIPTARGKATWAPAQVARILSGISN